MKNLFVKANTKVNGLSTSWNNGTIKLFIKVNDDDTVDMEQFAPLGPIVKEMVEHMARREPNNVLTSTGAIRWMVGTMMTQKLINLPEEMHASFPQMDKDTCALDTSVQLQTVSCINQEYLEGHMEAIDKTIKELPMEHIAQVGFVKMVDMVLEASNERILEDVKEKHTEEEVAELMAKLEEFHAAN